MPLKLGETAQIRKALDACAVCKERGIIGAVFGNAGRRRRKLAGKGLCCCGREAFAHEPSDSRKLVEQRAREACPIVMPMNGEPRLRITPAGEQWQQRA